MESEREKALMNRKKYGGHDQQSSLFSSIPNRTTISPATESRSNGGGSNGVGGDAVTATEQRVAKLALGEEAPADSASTPTGGRAHPVKSAKAKPKLSQISVCLILPC